MTDTKSSENKGLVRVGTDPKTKSGIFAVLTRNPDGSLSSGTISANLRLKTDVDEVYAKYTTREKTMAWVAELVQNWADAVVSSCAQRYPKAKVGLATYLDPTTGLMGPKYVTKEVSFDRKTGVGRVLLSHTSDKQPIAEIYCDAREGVLVTYQAGQSMVNATTLLPIGSTTKPRAADHTRPEAILPQAGGHGMGFKQLGLNAQKEGIEFFIAGTITDEVTKRQHIVSLAPRIDHETGILFMDGDVLRDFPSSIFNIRTVKPSGDGLVQYLRFRDQEQRAPLLDALHMAHVLFRTTQPLDFRKDCLLSSLQAEAPPCTRDDDTAMAVLSIAKERSALPDCKFAATYVNGTPLKFFDLTPKAPTAVSSMSLTADDEDVYEYKPRSPGHVFDDEDDNEYRPRSPRAPTTPEYKMEMEDNTAQAEAEEAGRSGAHDSLIVTPDIKRYSRHVRGETAYASVSDLVRYMLEASCGSKTALGYTPPTNFFRDVVQRVVTEIGDYDKLCVKLGSGAAARQFQRSVLSLRVLIGINENVIKAAVSRLAPRSLLTPKYLTKDVRQIGPLLQRFGLPAPSKSEQREVYDVSPLVQWLLVRYHGEHEQEQKFAVRVRSIGEHVQRQLLSSDFLDKHLVPLETATKTEIKLLEQERWSEFDSDVKRMWQGTCRALLRMQNFLRDHADRIAKVTKANAERLREATFAVLHDVYRTDFYFGPYTDERKSSDFLLVYTGQVNIRVSMAAIAADQEESPTKRARTDTESKGDYKAEPYQEPLQARPTWLSPRLRDNFTVVLSATCARDIVFALERNQSEASWLESVIKAVLRDYCGAWDSEDAKAILTKYIVTQLVTTWATDARVPWADVLDQLLTDTSTFHF